MALAVSKALPPPMGIIASIPPAFTRAIPSRTLLMWGLGFTSLRSEKAIPARLSMSVTCSYAPLLKVPFPPYTSNTPLTPAAFRGASSSLTVSLPKMTSVGLIQRKLCMYIYPPEKLMWFRKLYMVLLFGRVYITINKLKS